MCVQKLDSAIHLDELVSLKFRPGLLQIFNKALFAEMYMGSGHFTYQRVSKPQNTFLSEFQFGINCPEQFWPTTIAPKPG